MIRIVKQGEKLDPQSLVGKYVLRDAGLIYAALGRPRIVTSVSGSRVYVDEERMRWVEEDGTSLHLLDGTGEREPDGHWGMNSVACVCDSFEDVNVVLRERRRLDNDFTAFLSGSKRRVAALHGLDGAAPADAPPSP